MKMAGWLLFCLSLVWIMPDHVQAHGWMAPQGAAQQQNPVENDSASRGRGRTLFENFCSSCHGEEATGLPREKTGLNSQTPDLPGRLKTHSPGDFHWKILNGRKEMPGFREDLSDTDIWDIINYIYTLGDK